MPSPKQIGIGIIISPTLVSILCIFIVPFSSFQLEYNLIPWFSRWDIYFLTLIIPLYFIYGKFFNSAGRAIHPLTKRYVDTALVIVILAIFAGGWFLFIHLFLIPYVEYYLYSNISISYSSELKILLFYIASVIASIVFPLIASPTKNSTAINSFFKWFT